MSPIIFLLFLCYSTHSLEVENIAPLLVRCSSEGPNFWCLSCYNAQICTAIVPRAFDICNITDCIRRKQIPFRVPDESALSPPNITFPEYLLKFEGDPVDIVCAVEGMMEPPVVTLSDPTAEHSWGHQQTGRQQNRAFIEDQSSSLKILKTHRKHKIKIPMSVLDPTVEEQLAALNELHNRYGDLDGEAATEVKKEHMDKTKIDSTARSGNTVTYRRKINYATVQDTGNYTCTGKSGNRVTVKTLFLNVTRDVCGDCHKHTVQQICGSDCMDYSSFCDLKRTACLSGVPISPRSFWNCSYTNQVERDQEVLQLQGFNTILTGATTELELYCGITSMWGRGREIHWMKNGEPLIVSGAPVSGNKLHVPNAGKKWAGEYFCYYDSCERIESNCHVQSSWSPDL
uniref:Putative secretory peptide-36 n=1 Tax=Pleurobrachia bachei TaxID=34499 RepID=M4H264_PLEBA|nr:putative secretory peptide-36 [Pleurobrachia bachei]|eukprot:sb/3465346/